MIEAALGAMPVIAIMRGVEPDEVKEIGAALYDSGVRCMEVTLNSPQPFQSIELLAKSLPDDCLVGAGTVLAPEDVRKVKDVGGELIVAPNTSAPVIQVAVELCMNVVPGVATPTEAFAAVEAGATWLKLFPACTYGPRHIKSMRAVLPGHIHLLAVGGLDTEQIAEWQAAGAAGFGIGSELYHKGDTVADVRRKVAIIKAAL